MENKTEPTEAENSLIDYQEKIRQQTEIAEKAADAHERNPNAASALAFDRELDTLFHYFNAQKGKPFARAQIIAELARRLALAKAIEPLPNDE